MAFIDLYSDTVTRPTRAMRQAMFDAEVGDEQKGEDPTVNRLQTMVAELLGKETALFLPSGTMCNEIAIKVHTRPGDCVISDRDGHIVRFEAGGPAFLSGVLVEQLHGDRGRFTPAQVENAIAAGSWHVPRTSLLCLEQTHNMGGGAIWPVDQLQAVCATAHDRGLKTHLDGARLLNAVVATGIPAKTMVAGCDSAWIDLTKGLGAPVGAVLAGTADFIREARRYKHLFGGAMRQAGVIAAAGVHALTRHVDRLADDHANAKRLAAGLAEIPGVAVETPIETNMVYFTVANLAPTTALERIFARGVRMSGPMAGRIRAVTHLDVSTADIDTAIATVAAVARDR